jgi:hypothetical protein
MTSIPVELNKPVSEKYGFNTLELPVQLGAINIYFSKYLCYSNGTLLK